MLPEQQTVNDAEIWRFLQFLMRLTRTAKRGARTVLEDCPRCHFSMLEQLHCSIVRHGQNGAIYMGDLAEAMHASPQIVSRAIRTLEQDGLAERASDPADRRRTLVRLTPQGEQDLRTCEEALRAYLRTVWQHLGAEHGRALLKEASLLETALAEAAPRRSRPAQPDRDRDMEKEEPCL